LTRKCENVREGGGERKEGFKKEKSYGDVFFSHRFLNELGKKGRRRGGSEKTGYWTLPLKKGGGKRKKGGGGNRHL